MEKTILANVSGFTPLIDSLVEKYSIITAAVFGKIWRYSQMGDGICMASQERIAGELGITRQTLIKHIEILKADGYIIDLTPNLNGAPHKYADTGKAGLITSISAYTYNEQNHTDKAMDDNDQPVKNFDTHLSKNFTGGVKNFDTHLSKNFTQRYLIKTQDKIRDDIKAERFEKIANALAELQGGGLKSSDADLIDQWLEHHEDKWILAAIDAASLRGARSASYVDKILVGWAANGYPMTHEEKIKSMRRTNENNRGGNGKRATNNQYTHEELEQAVKEYREFLAERGLSVP